MILGLAAPSPKNRLDSSYVLRGVRCQERVHDGPQHVNDKSVLLPLGSITDGVLIVPWST